MSILQLRRYQTNVDSLVVARIWSERFSARWPVETQFLDSTLAALSDHPTGGCQVAILAGSLEGFVGWLQSPNDSTQGSIVAVAVSRAAERHGTGTKLVRAALDDLARRNVKEVVIGGWAYPQFWHGIPGECAAAISFFQSLGWELGERNADLLVNLESFKWPRGLRERLAAQRIEIQPAKASETKDLLELVRAECPSFTNFYEDEARRNGVSQVRVALVDGVVAGAIIRARFPRCPGAHWHHLLGQQMCAMGALFVRRSARRKGVGLGLCAYTLDEFSQSGYRVCYLEWATLLKMYAQLGAGVWREYVQACLRLRATRHPPSKLVVEQTAQTSAR
jgi:GNAT superfamily N-acetyltransferase